MELSQSWATQKSKTVTSACPTPRTVPAVHAAPGLLRFRRAFAPAVIELASSTVMSDSDSDNEAPQEVSFTSAHAAAVTQRGAERAASKKSQKCAFSRAASAVLVPQAHTSNAFPSRPCRQRKRSRAEPAKETAPVSPVQKVAVSDALPLELLEAAEEDLRQA